VALLALPARHEVQQVHALGHLARLLAGLAAQLDAARREEGALRRGVRHLDEPSVEVLAIEKSQSRLSFALHISSKSSWFAELVTYNFTCERRYGHERGRADAEDGSYCLLWIPARVRIHSSGSKLLKWSSCVRKRSPRRSTRPLPISKRRPQCLHRRGVSVVSVYRTRRASIQHTWYHLSSSQSAQSHASQRPHSSMQKEDGAGGGAL